MDIFDEADLLAIANDSGNSSSHAENSSEASSVASDLFLDESESKGFTSKTPPIVAHESSAGQKADTGDDSESEDDGFLDSWVAESKKFQEQIMGEQKCADECNANSQVDEKVDTNVKNDDNSCVGNDEDNPKDSASAVDQSQEMSNDAIDVQLGSSVLNWISNYDSRRNKVTGVSNHKDAELNNDAIVGIQQDATCSEVSGQLPSSLLIELTKNRNTLSSDKSISKRMTAVIEAKDSEEGRDIKNKSAIAQSKRFEGNAETFIYHERQKGGSMVDCLARYDYQKKCYILELVDVTVTDLRLYSGSDDVETRLGANNPAPDIGLEQKIVDPRLLAKRAEDQLKKLKRGKRRSVDEESNPKTKAKTNG